MSERESIARTLGVAGGVALLCSLLVSSAVRWLRPMQLAYQSLDNDPALVRSLCHLHPAPDLTVILNPPISLAAERVRSRRLLPDRYERSAALQFHAATMYRDENNWRGPTVLRRCKTKKAIG